MNKLGTSVARLIDLLLMEADVTVMIICGPREALAVAALLELVFQPGIVIDLVRKLALPQLLNVIEAFDLYVDSDSGPKHIVAVF